MLDSQFTVEWNNVHVKDSPDLGPFSFQLSLYKNGTIAFVYKYLPIPITNVSDTHHPVKVGISDAYIRDKNILCKLDTYIITKILKFALDVLSTDFVFQL